MNYTITHSCGHTETVDLFGKTSEREYRIAKMEENICPECRQAQLAATMIGVTLPYWVYKALSTRHETRQDSYDSKTRTIDVYFNPNAEKIVNIKAKLQIEYKRLSALCEASPECEKYSKQLSDVMSVLETSADTEYVEVLNARCSNMKSIANITLAHNIIKSISKMNDDVTLTEEETAEIEEKREAELTNDIITPESVNKQGCVEIFACECSARSEIRAVYPRDAEFVDIVKRFGYRWNGANWAWTLKLSFKTENPADRIAELGNALLLEGFTVKIKNEEAREKAVLGTFEKQCTRWICELDGKIIIEWKERNDTLYKAAMRIKGARYNDGNVIVPKESYAEIFDFADINEFKISSGTEAIIANWKKEMERAEVVSPQKHVEEKKPDILEEILNSSCEVIEDLKDI